MKRIHRRRIRHTLAVSTVIANMMMITITLSLAAILIAWTGTTYGLFASGAQIFYQQRGQAMEERFVVENVFFQDSTTSSTQLQVYVRNVGVEEIKIVAIYVNGTCAVSTGVWVNCDEQTPVPPDTPCNSNTPVGDCIPVGGWYDNRLPTPAPYTLNYSPPCLKDNPPCKGLTTGSILYIVVVSARGNRATYTVRLYVPSA